MLGFGYERRIISSLLAFIARAGLEKIKKAVTART